jgi:hypothetical protein
MPFRYELQWHRAHLLSPTIAKPLALKKRHFGTQERNNATGLRRICVRLQGTSAGAYHKISAGGCNAVDGRKDKQGGGIISLLRPCCALMRCACKYARLSGDREC